MSVTDPSADDVQPDQGQGDDGSGNPAYAEYLSRIPEEARGTAEEAFKAWDANYTRKAQEYSEYKKGWEPYDQLGVQSLSPEEVQWALQFRQAAVENPQSVWEWAQDYAKEHGLNAQQTAQLEQQQADEFGMFQQEDPSKQFESLLDGRLGPLQQQLEQIVQWRQQAEEQAQQSQVAQAAQAAIADLKAKHADSLPADLRDQFEEIVAGFALKHAEPGVDSRKAVEAGWNEFSTLFNAIEKASLQSKADAPAPAETGGVPDVSTEKITNIKDASVQALEFFKNQNRA